MTGPQKTALDHLSAKELKTIEREQGKGAYLDLIKKLGSTPVGPKISRELEEKDDIAELIQRLLTEEEKLHVRARKDERDVI